MLKLLVGVEFGLELDVCDRGGGKGGERGVGLAVRDLGGGAGGGGEAGLEFAFGLGASGPAGCRIWVGVIPSTREALAESVGEWPGETGSSKPLAVLARRRDPADPGAESR